MELLTEHRPADGLAVYGFLRLMRISRARRDALVAPLTEHCRNAES
ncbi:hypothetical protein AB0C93_06155 [Streptomyces sp. NPDC048518]